MSLARQVGRREGRVAGAHHGVEREALERQIEQHRLVLQEVELLPGDLRARLEVDQRELLARARRDRGERSANLRGVPTRRSSRKSASPPSGVSGWTRFGIGASAASSARSASATAASRPAISFLSRRPSAVCASRSWLVELALARGLVLVAQAVRLAELGLRRGKAFLGADRAVDVGRDAAAPAALDDLVASLGEAAGIEHAGTGKHSAPRRAKPARLDPGVGAGVKSLGIPRPWERWPSG